MQRLDGWDSTRGIVWKWGEAFRKVFNNAYENRCRMKSLLGFLSISYRNLLLWKRLSTSTVHLSGSLSLEVLSLFTAYLFATQTNPIPARLGMNFKLDRLQNQISCLSVSLWDFLILDWWSEWFQVFSVNVPSWVFLAVLALWYNYNTSLGPLRVIGMHVESSVYLSAFDQGDHWPCRPSSFGENVNLPFYFKKDSLRVTLMDKQPIVFRLVFFGLWQLPISSFLRSLLKQRKWIKLMKKMMYLLFVLNDLLPAVVVVFLQMILLIIVCRSTTPSWRQSRKNTWGN